MMRNQLTAAFMGITTPIAELYQEIEQRGWEVTKVHVKDDTFYAEAKNPYGEKIEKTGPTDNTAVGHVLIAIMRHETIRHHSKTGGLKPAWYDKLPQIAKAYAKAPVYEAKAASAWRELAHDLQSRAHVIAGQIEVKIVDSPHPYDELQDMIEDVTKKRHITVSRAHSQHPIWNIDQVVAYRLVRDVLGYCAGGGDYGWLGENLATAAIMPLLSPTAQQAFFTESLGRAAYHATYHIYGPHKVAFIDDEIESDDESSEDGGVDPGLTIVPGKIPDAHEKKASQHWSQLDPNHQWDPGVDPLPNNAYLWIREQNGLDPLDWQGLRSHAHSLDSGWAKLAHPDGSPDRDSQKQAVVNALRASILSPRKNPRWAATHYQHLMHLPANTSDPMRFWDALEIQREHHNEARGLPPTAHRGLWDEELQQFRGWVKSLYPHLHDADVDVKARSELFHMLAEEEEMILQDDADSQLSANDLETLAFKNIKRRLKAMTRDTINDKTDHLAAPGQPDPAAYGSFLMNHLKTLSGAGRYADDLVDAAQEDVSDHKGRGHHFRKRALELDIPGLNAQQASHAWMLLQPKTSGLAILTPQVIAALGHSPEDANSRDYFKLERELHAGKDASGYSHVPLGQFSAGLDDYHRGGPGHHTDHRALHPINPRPYDQIDWQAEAQVGEGQWNNPYWWEATSQARDVAARDWDDEIGSQNPSHKVPFRTARIGQDPVESFEHWWNSNKPMGPWKSKKLAQYAVAEEMSRKELESFIDLHKSDVVAFEKFKDEVLRYASQFDYGLRESATDPRSPNFIHPESGEVVEGQSGQTLMQHIRDAFGISTKDAWALGLEASKG